MAKERLRVTAEDTVVFGHRFGEEFDADLEAEGLNREALIEGGHLKVVKPKSSKKEE
jgi:hypothetical protein